MLTFTTLYPNSVRPRHGIFVQTRLRHLLGACPVEAKVVAPVPFFPSRLLFFGKYAEFASVPAFERLQGIDIEHPRFPVVPKVGMLLQPPALARAAEAAIRKIQARGWPVDVIDAHYLFPDGVAAARVSQRLGCPFVITARGSDVNVIAKMAQPQRLILDACRQAQRVIAVSAALKAELVTLGVPESHVEVLRNGVDPAVFKPHDRTAARAAFGMGPEKVVLSVGNLLPEKGHDLVVAALARLPDAKLLLVGDGPEHRRLVALAAELGVESRMQVLGNMPQEKLAALYSAADVLALGSEVEGWPNVLLESLACGTPVVATDVGGVREIVCEPCAGMVVERRDPDAFSSALAQVLLVARDRAAVRAYAQRFDWKTVVERQYDVLLAAALKESVVS